MSRKGTLVLHKARVVTTHMNAKTRGQSTRIQDQTNLPGKLLEGNNPGGEKVAPLTHHDQPRASSRINDMTAGREHTTDNRHFYKVKCKASCCFNCSYCAWAFPKERIKSRVSRLLLQKLQIKVCEKCFLCHSIILCSTCNKCQKCCFKSACRGKTSKLLANLAGSGGPSESCSNPERGLHPPLSDPAKTHKVSHSHKLLWQSPQE